jgi:hypothetical protein
MKAKLVGLLVALVMLGFGGHMLASPAEYTNLDTSKMSGRHAVVKKLIGQTVNTIGVMPSAIILLGSGALLGFLNLKSRASASHNR